MSCALIRPHRATVTQGNIINDQTAHALHPGLTKIAVENIMGTPLLANNFTPNRTHYVYTHQEAYQPSTINRLTCLFHQDHLSAIDRS